MILLVIRDFNYSASIFFFVRVFMYKKYSYLPGPATLYRVITGVPAICVFCVKSCKMLFLCRVPIGGG